MTQGSAFDKNVVKYVVRGAYERQKMYDRHKPIIKWYEYDARKLYQNAEAEEVTEDTNAVAAPEPELQAPPEESYEETAASGGDDGALSGSELDDEVARIMAAFSGAKQNGVDDVFAMMAAQEAENAGGDSGSAGSEGSGGESQDDLLASLLAPKQNTVDDLVAKAREG